MTAKLSFKIKLFLSQKFLFSYTIGTIGALKSSEFCDDVEVADGEQKWFLTGVKFCASLKIFSLKFVAICGLKKLKQLEIIAGGDGNVSFLCDDGLNVKADGHLDIHGLSSTLFIG